MNKQKNNSKYKRFSRKTVKEWKSYISVKKNFKNREYYRQNEKNQDLHNDRQYIDNTKNRIHKKDDRDDLRFISKNNRRLQTLIKKKTFQTRRRNENNGKFVFRKNRRLQIVSSEKSLYRQHLRFRDGFRKFNRRKSSSKKYRQKNRRKLFHQKNKSRNEKFRNEKNRNRNYKQQESLNRKYERQKNSFFRHYKYERNRFRFRRRFPNLRSRTKFWFSNIMDFNSKNTFVVFFIKRFQHITKIENENVVFRVFFMCLKEFALEWHISLSAVVRMEMNHDLRIWKNELFRKYKFNRFEFFKKVESFIFTFDDFLFFSQYIIRKINYLQNVGIINEDMMIQYFWNGLDSQLILATQLRENGNSLENFEKRIRQNESTVKKIYDFNKKKTIRSKSCEGSKSFWSIEIWSRPFELWKK